METGFGQIHDKRIVEFDGNNHILSPNERYVRIIEIRNPLKPQESYAIVEYIDIFNPIERIKRKKIKINALSNALIEFSKQEKRNINNVYGKHDIYSIITKKCLNLPENMRSRTINDLGQELLNVIGNSTSYIRDRMPKKSEIVTKGKEIVGNIAYNINNSIQNYRKSEREKAPKKRYADMGVREQRQYRKKIGKRIIIITFVSTLAILSIPQINYQLNKRQLGNSAIVYISQYAKIDQNDRNIINNFPRFERLFRDLSEENYSDITRDDVIFLSDVFLQMSISNANNQLPGYINYDMMYEKVLPERSTEFNDLNDCYWRACNERMDGTYNQDAGYYFCCRTLNLIFASERNNYSYKCNGKEIPLELTTIRNFYFMDPLEKLIVLNELEGIIRVHGFEFKNEDIPIWCRNFKDGTATMSSIDFLSEIRELKQDCINKLQSNLKK